ncbi:HEPN-associated N-terminal domain-containing protein [Bradyrhizobium sp. STM 3562]|uniref:HEPN-associated N-terminal domain-containing protein n=1 Tax=Bradyrhizobium sp. STM 3562 TaxID=578924 RepID=UPI003890EB6E
MSRAERDLYPGYSHEDRCVCAGCFEDDDLKGFIRDNATKHQCSFCGSRSKSAPLEEIADFIEGRMLEFYGKAVEQLPYESREGGYQGWHTDTDDLLFGQIGLELPKDRDGKLAQALLDLIGDDEWCEYDWLTLDFDQSLKFGWLNFCTEVKHARRFFFHKLGGEDSGHPDDRSFFTLLSDIAKLADDLGLIKDIPGGYSLFRARPRGSADVKYETAKELGPPPEEYATQSNRMNPPGIPMFYGAETAALAVAEIRNTLFSLGTFKTNRSIRILDLAALPKLPGFFSKASQRERLGLSFLHEFSNLISEPVARDDRTHVEYIPTQVYTEFLRDFRFEGGPLDGIRYKSATRHAGANVVLFATTEHVHDSKAPRDPGRWLRLASVKHS